MQSPGKRSGRSSRASSASSQGDELLAQAVEVQGVKVLAAQLQGADAKTLRDTLDKLKDKLKSAAIVLAAVDGDKVQLAAGVTPDTVGKVKAGELVNFVAQQVGGKGGGKPDMAMAGGTQPAALPTPGQRASLGGRASVNRCAGIAQEPRSPTTQPTLHRCRWAAVFMPAPRVSGRRPGFTAGARAAVPAPGQALVQWLRSAMLLPPGASAADLPRTPAPAAG